ncbi:RNA polymerase subunit sigma-70 [Actinopolyspora erythraea]|nr:sigma-70 family RNA polymerase sigma factor [Actinopolyspora erythraea]ASU81322.1 RNA polymerase subunit sigma-70 [Actinopolyspora erythraea]
MLQATVQHQRTLRRPPARQQAPQQPPAPLREEAVVPREPTPTDEPREPTDTPSHTPAPAEPAEPDGWNHVRAAQHGDNQAFGRLYDQYAHLVYRYVLLRVSDHCLAEDITSETFARALRRIASVSYQGRDVAAWFITIAKNLLLDHIKSSRNKLEVPLADPGEANGGTAQHPPGPEQHVLAEAAHHELMDCVRRLNPDQRECIRLRFLLGLSVTETATLMNRNEGAVKALQHRAIRRLAQLLPDDPR